MENLRTLLKKLHHFHFSFSACLLDVGDVFLMCKNCHPQVPGLGVLVIQCNVLYSILFYPAGFCGIFWSDENLSPDWPIRRRWISSRTNKVRVLGSSLSMTDGFLLLLVMAVEIGGGGVKD